jgi:hypothetical protein
MLSTFNQHLTSKLQFSPNFTLNNVADSNYRGKCDIGGFLIFEWTLYVIGENSILILCYIIYKNRRGSMETFDIQLNIPEIRIKYMRIGKGEDRIRI